MNPQMTIAVPAGIGDVSWILSKLVHVSDRVDLHIQVADGTPYRTVPFLRMLPWIKSANYGDFTYTDLFYSYRSQEIVNWGDIEKLESSRIFLTNNEHLESGKRLEEWLPDLPTDFHYKIPVSRLAEVRIGHMLDAMKDKFGRNMRRLYGISAASYRGAQAWSTWEYEDWATFINLWQTQDPYARFVLMGGGWDDLTRSLFEEFSDVCFDAVGKTSIGSAIELHRHLDGYVGFSSGLGIVRTVLGGRTFMLWPAFQEKLSTSWAPPEMIKSGAYTCCTWQDPAKVFEKIIEWKT